MARTRVQARGITKNGSIAESDRNIRPRERSIVQFGFDGPHPHAARSEQGDGPARTRYRFSCRRRRAHSEEFTTLSSGVEIDHDAQTTTYRCFDGVDQDLCQIEVEMSRWTDDELIVQHRDI